MSPHGDTLECETLSMTEACQRLGISKEHGYDLAAEGKFPCRTIRLGRRVLVLRREFEALVGNSARPDAP